MCIEVGYYDWFTNLFGQQQSGCKFRATDQHTAPSMQHYHKERSEERMPGGVPAHESHVGSGFEIIRVVSHKGIKDVVARSLETIKVQLLLNFVVTSINGITTTKCS